MKIYTKKGDRGETSLLGGTRVPKHHIRIEGYGTIDELNSFIGHIRDFDIEGKMSQTLLEIQSTLFTVGASLATDSGKEKVKKPDLTRADIEMLEKEIDRYDQELSPLKYFVLPGGHPAVSMCHVARCVCRRAERLVTKIAENDLVDEIVIEYLNRLSDYLFVCARKAAFDLGIDEIPWIPKK